MSFGLFLSSSILENRKHDVSESGSVSVLMWGGEDIYSVGPLKRADLNHWTTGSFPRQRVHRLLLRNGCLFIRLLHSNGCTSPFWGLCPATGLYATVYSLISSMFQDCLLMSLRDDDGHVELNLISGDDLIRIRRGSRLLRVLFIL
jgi:hypothetical protein